MFSWICPKCGTEVPPSYSECPRCSAVPVAEPPQPPAPPPAYPPPPAYQQPVGYPPPPPAYQQPVGYPPPQQPQTYAPPAPPPPAGPAPLESNPSNRPPKPKGILFGGPEDVAPSAPPQYQPPPAYPQGGGYPPPQQPPQYAPPPPQYAPPPPQYAPPYAAPAAPKAGLPTWLVMVLAAFVFTGIVAGAVWFKRRGADTVAEAEPIGEAKSAATAPAEGGAHRLSKHLELSGFRLSEGAGQRAQVKMVVVNHSAADTGDIEMNLTLRDVNAKPGTDPVGTATVKIPAIGPNSYQEASAPLKTKRRIYELPDWQFLRAEFEITSP
ncbi:MAG: hypothetical protein SFV18_17145 [Bryobacteraceae bacterium]|nr:hypothetical protein [Bryobacteraceae bacterium]